MKLMRRTLAAALVLALLALPCAALEEDGSLEARMEAFRREYGLTEQNFSLCYRNTVTGEEYRFNDTKFMVAASTFKLPLNLYYYELAQDGALDAGARVGGLSLDDAHYQSLVWSDNEVSLAMLYRLGSFRTYKTLMRKYFTMPDEAIDAIYYVDNYYCTAMMLDALQYLYDRQSQFPEMLELMRQAQPGEYFARYAEDCPVAHKYGWFTDSDTGVTAVNDVGIVYAAEPFLLAVYTADAPGGEETVAQACRCLLDYHADRQAEAEAQAVEAQAAETKPQAPPPVQAAPAPQPPAPQPEAPPAAPEPESPEEPPEETVRRNLWWMILVASSIFLVADLGVLYLMRRGGPEAWMERREASRKNRRSG